MPPPQMSQDVLPSNVLDIIREAWEKLRGSVHEHTTLGFALFDILWIPHFRFASGLAS